ncbi:MAG: cytochrome c biogenesis protein CcsA [Planctomycetota bacterium]
MQASKPSVAAGGGGRATFALHAVAALACLCALNWLVATKVPLHIQMLETSYLIFFYHFPSAILCTVFFTINAVFSVFYLATQKPSYDLHARVFAEIGLVACCIALATGSVWARMAWGEWWSFGDPRLLWVAIMCLSYAAYVVLQQFMEPGERRMRYAAVFAVAAAINVPLVKYAIQFFGENQHPMEMTSSDSSLKGTQWFGAFAFLLFYLLVYRWRIAKEKVRASIESSLSAARRIEEGRLA